MIANIAMNKNRNFRKNLFLFSLLAVMECGAVLGKNSTNKLLVKQFMKLKLKPERIIHLKHSQKDEGKGDLRFQAHCLGRREILGF